MQGIYKIEAPSGHFYIGSSTNVRRRLNTHKRELRRGSHINSALKNAASKYGIDALAFSEFACVLDRAYLRALEQSLIDDLRPEYNISKSADCALFDRAVVAKRVSAISKPVVRLSDGFVFKSGYEAARHHNIKSPDNLSTAIRKGWKFAGHFWAFVGDQVTHEQLEARWNAQEIERKKRAAKAATQSRSKAVRRLVDGKVFTSAMAASKSAGYRTNAISEAICKNLVRAGSRWEYV